MLIECNIKDVEYIFQKAEEQHISWLFKCLRDFPKSLWSSKGRVRDWVDMCDEIDDDVLEKDPIPEFKHLILILKRKEDNEKLGVVIFDYNYSPADPEYTGVYIQYVAIHPEHRGNGYYTVLHDAITWLCNQYMQADEGFYKIMEEAPQVKAKAESKGGKLSKLTIPISDVEVLEQDIVTLSLKDVDLSMSSNDKKLGKVKDRLGNNIETKKEKLKKNKP